MKPLLLSAMIVLVAFCNRADSSLIPITDGSVLGGVDNVTSDSDTGLDWLDLTASSGPNAISFDAIQLQFLSGGLYEGWRHATHSEVENLLFVSAGLFQGNIPTLDPLAVQFVQLVGVTQTGIGNGVVARGLYEDGGVTNLPGVGQVAYRPNGSIFSPFTEARIDLDQPLLNDQVHTIAGHWLVRAVPEPSSITAIAAALIIGSGFKRRKK